MSENVIGLRDDLYTAPGEPNPRVIAHLEAWLQAARRGEVDGIAIAASRPNGRISFNYYLGPEPATFRVVAAVSLLDGDLKQTMNELATDGTIDDAS